MAAMEKHTAYFNLLDQARKPGCPVCAQVHASLRAYLDSYLYESVTSPDVWDRLTACGGYCAAHSRQLEAFSDGLAVSLFYRHLLRRDIQALSGEGPSLSHRLSQALGRSPKAQPCPACGHQAEAEAQQLRLLGQAMEEPEFWAAWKARPGRPGEGLCLGHLRAALPLAGSRQAELLALESGRLEALALEMDEYVRKSDHSCSEKMGAEGDAWRRALQAYRGLRG
jgi:hypothetical protein